jgi:hypothetical protein
MPGGDKTGPMGMGAMTGRGAGFCSGINRSGNANAVQGRGFGMGSGRGSWFPKSFGGHGWRNQYFATGQPGWMRFGPAVADDKKALKQRSQALRSELDAIKKQLDDME